MFRIFHGTSYDFIKYWRHAVVITVAFILVGLTALGIRGVQYSIEFTSGTLMEVEFAKPPKADDIRLTVDKAGFPGSTIQQFGSPTDYTITAQGRGPDASVMATDSTAKHIEAALHAQFATFVEGFRGWGRSLRRAVGRWYTGRSVDALAYQAVKYRSREGMTHRDLLRLAHPAARVGADIASQSGPVQPSGKFRSGQAKSVPSATLTAWPPMRAVASFPLSTSNSSLILDGRPISMPCSMVNAVEPSPGASKRMTAPAKAAAAEPVAGSSGIPSCGASIRA